jgi:hypothetical protein
MSTSDKHPFLNTTTGADQGQLTFLYESKSIAFCVSHVVHHTFSCNFLFVCFLLEDLEESQEHTFSESFLV